MRRRGLPGGDNRSRAARSASNALRQGHAALPPAPAPTARPSAEGARLEPRAGGRPQGRKPPGGGRSSGVLGIGGRGEGRRPTKEGKQRGHGARTGSARGRGTAGEPSPFRPAPSAPLPHRGRPSGTPRPGGELPGSASPQRGGPAPSPGPGTREHALPPAPRLPVAVASPLSGAGTSTPPSQVAPNLLPISPPRHAAGDVPRKRLAGPGGWDQCHPTANCPRLPFPRQSGPPPAA